MKKKPTNYYKQIISLLEELHQLYPDDSLGRHISLALSDYPDLFVVPDKEILFAFQKYQTELELDMKHIASEDYIRKIEEDATHLFDRPPDDEWEDED